MNKKLILLLVVVIAIGGLLYFKNFNKGANEPSQTIALKTYTDSKEGFEFQYNSEWNLPSNGSGYDPAHPYILIRSGIVSDEPCDDLGCLPKSGDREELTKGDTFEGAPPLNPWFRILKVQGTKWVSIQVTDVNTSCISEEACQEYINKAPLQSKQKLGADYKTYNEFVDLISSFKFLNK